MYFDLEEVKHIKDYVIWLRFADGVSGQINLEPELYGEMFEPLKDLEAFKSFSIHSELKVLIWKNGADFSPKFLYENIKKVV